MSWLVTYTNLRRLTNSWKNQSRLLPEGEKLLRLSRYVLVLMVYSMSLICSLNALWEQKVTVLNQIFQALQKASQIISEIRETHLW